MAADYKQAFVRTRSKTTGEWFVHPELRERVIADAAAKGVTANERIVQILCGRFGVPYEAKPHKQQADPDPTFFNFRMPMPLFLVINAGYPNDYTVGVRHALCGHYGLGIPAPQKRSRGKRAAAA